jgi:hypothetical protein
MPLVLKEPFFRRDQGNDDEKSDYHGGGGQGFPQFQPLRFKVIIS